MKINYAALIRQSLNMGEVAQYYGLQFNRAGFSPCPFHAEKTPSFKVQDSQYAHCFGCGWNGDVIKFVMELLGLSFRAACERLNDDFRLGYPLTRKPTLREQRELQRKHKERLAAQRAEQERREAWEAEYWRRWDAWITYDQNKHLYAPKTPDEPLHPLYVEAVTNIDYAAYLIDCLPPLQDYTLHEKRGDE